MEKRERGEHRGGDESLKEKTGDERRLKRKKKTEPRKGGMRQAREGERGAAGTSSGKQSGRKQNNCGMA